MQIIFAKGGHYALKELSESGYDVVSLDWTIEPGHAKTVCKEGQVFQGNMDPCALYSPKVGDEKV